MKGEMVLFASHRELKPRLSFKDSGFMVRGKEDAVDQQMSSMEIETYFSAFPALTKPPEASVEASINATVEEQEPAVSADSKVEIKPAFKASAASHHGASNKYHDKPGTPPSQRKYKQSRSNGVRPKFSPSSKKVSVGPVPNKPNKATKGDKLETENYKDRGQKERRGKGRKIKEPKRWKLLNDLKDEDYLPLQHIGSNPQFSEGVSDWLQLTNEELDEILTDGDNCMHTQDRFLSLPWADSNQCVTDSSEVWSPKVDSHCEEEDNSYIHLSAHRQDMNKTQGAPGAGDFDELCARINSVKFCEDLDPGSRMLKLFGDDQLVQMIKETKWTELANEESWKIPSCKHCEETYEVTLDSECFNSDAPSNSDSPDARLNFDWTKYDPPFWSHFTEQDKEPLTRKLTDNHRQYCPCDFCRSRIWKRTCGWCGTPIV